MTYLRDLYAILERCGDKPPPFEEWHAYWTENAEFWPIVGKDRKLIGGVLFKGHTVHVSVAPEWQCRWLTKTMLKAYRVWTHDCDIVAHPHKSNARAIELCRRLGMRHDGTDPTGQFELFVKPATT